MNVHLDFTPGLPSACDGPCVFLLWDGSICEGGLYLREGRRWLVTHNYADPQRPERIEMPADTGRVLGFAVVTPNRDLATQCSPPESTPATPSGADLVGALRMVVLALDELQRRGGVTEQHDDEDPDGAVADLKALAMQYAGGSVPAATIDMALARPLGELFKAHMPH